MSKIKSVRLSEFLRGTILKSVMQEFSLNFLKPHGFEAPEHLKEAIAAEGYSAALSLWHKCYGDIDFDQIPKWALDKSNQFTVAMENDTSNTFACRVHWGKDKVQAERRPCKPAIDILLSPEDWTTWLGRREYLEALKEQHNVEYNKLRSEIKPVLDSFNTTKQLLETWPSVEKFLPANIADPDKGINLPALSLSRLEAKINGKV